jgi:hypothetical protein
MLGGDVVYVFISGLRDEAVVEVMCAQGDYRPWYHAVPGGPLGDLLPGRFEQTCVIDNPLADGTLRIAVAQLTPSALPLLQCGGCMLAAISFSGNAAIVTGSPRSSISDREPLVCVGTAHYREKVTGD